MTEQPPPSPNDPIPSDLVRDDPSFADLVLDFVNGLSQRLETMEDAMHTKDLESLRRAAHQLKGSGGGYGYPVLTQHAGELEQSAKAGALEACTTELAELQSLCKRIVVSPD